MECVKMSTLSIAMSFQSVFAGLFLPNGLVHVLDLLFARYRLNHLSRADAERLRSELLRSLVPHFQF